MKKELIREAAIDVIAENGFTEATMEKIANKAGIAVGTIYNYYQRKEDILDYIFAVEYKKRVDFLIQLKKQDTHPLEKIRRLIGFHFAEVKKNPNLAKVILKEKNSVEQENLNGIRKFAELPRYLSEIIQEGINLGLIRQCDPEILSIILYGAIEALMSKFFVEGEELQSQNIYNRAANEITQLLWNGLVTKAVLNASGQDCCLREELNQ